MADNLASATGARPGGARCPSQSTRDGDIPCCRYTSSAFFQLEMDKLRPRVRPRVRQWACGEADLLTVGN